MRIQTGEGRGECDLTQRVVIDRRDGLPLSKWRGHGVDFFSAWWACWFSKSMFGLRRVWLLPLGGDGRGVCFESG